MKMIVSLYSLLLSLSTAILDTYATSAIFCCSKTIFIQAMPYHIARNTAWALLLVIMFS